MPGTVLISHTIQSCSEHVSSIFHSGYITIIYAVSCCKLDSRSTFHSGYITIIHKCVVELIPKISTFHSGYITIKGGQFSICYCTSIYIPLWLYYNSDNTRLIIPRMRSTFHSGYITILPCFQLRFGCYNLHSTLVILQ